MRADNAKVLDALSMLYGTCDAWLVGACSHDLQFLIVALPPIESSDPAELTMNCSGTGNIGRELIHLVGELVKGLQGDGDDYAERVEALGKQFKVIEAGRPQFLATIASLVLSAKKQYDDAELHERLRFVMSYAPPIIHRILDAQFGATFHFFLAALIPCTHVPGKNFEVFSTGSYDTRDLKRLASYVESLKKVDKASPLLFAPTMGNA